VVALASPCAQADGPPRRVSNTLGSSLNPLGLQDRLTLERRWGLGSSKNPLLSDAHISLGLSNNLSPAYDRLGLWAELSPLSVLDIRAGVEPVVYFGTYGHLSAFPSYDSDFSKSARDRIKSQAVARAGVRWHVSPTLKLKLGRVVARSAAEFEWWKVDAPGEFFYEPTRDTLLDSDGDALMALSSQLLYELGRDKRVLAGLSHELTSVPAAPQNRIQRLGLLGIWKVRGRRLGLGEPTVVGGVFRYLEDPSKKGELGAVLAVSFGF
jgi:hypothetical protein